jgi:hypothetical protein
MKGQKQWTFYEMNPDPTRKYKSRSKEPKWRQHRNINKYEGVLRAGSNFSRDKRFKSF